MVTHKTYDDTLRTKFNGKYFCLLSNFYSICAYSLNVEHIFVNSSPVVHRSCVMCRWSGRVCDLTKEDLLLFINMKHFYAVFFLYETDKKYFHSFVCHTNEIILEILWGNIKIRGNGVLLRYREVEWEMKEEAKQQL